MYTKHFFNYNTYSITESQTCSSSSDLALEADWLPYLDHKTPCLSLQPQSLPWSPLLLLLQQDQLSLCFLPCSLLPQGLCICSACCRKYSSHIPFKLKFTHSSDHKTGEHGKAFLDSLHHIFPLAAPKTLCPSPVWYLLRLKLCIHFCDYLISMYLPC